MLRVGIVGLGFMGRIHLTCYRAIPGVTVAAICDADEKRLSKQPAAEGNISGADQPLDLSGIELYTDYEKMLSQTKLDIVSVTLPTYLHCDYTVKALNAGCDVLCEKPMALDPAQCRKMIAAAKKTRKTLQIGHCIRFWPEYVIAKEIIDSGRYGKVKAASFKRLSLAPTWTWDNWMLNSDKSGGGILDLHIHDTDFILHVFGMPKSVFAKAVVGPSGGFDHLDTNYEYKDERVISATGGWMMASSFGFEMSFSIILENAAILYNCNQSPTLKICPSSSQPFTPPVEKTDGYHLEIEHFIKTVTGQKVPAIITPADSMNSVRLVLAEKRSASTGKKVTIR